MNTRRHKFVVDCEYSGETNELISMAIVPLWPAGTSLTEVEVPDREFYEVISPLPRNLSPWVQENVVPHLGKPGIPYGLFQRKLELFLIEHEVHELHYDWCDDIAYFNRAMITGPGERIELPARYLAHIHHAGIEYHSQKGHSALHDARAISVAIRCRLVGVR